MEKTVLSIEAHRGVEVEVNQWGIFEATVGTDYCRADSMKGIRDQINQAMAVLANQEVSIPIVVFSGDHVLPDQRSEVVLWHSVDYNIYSFKGTDPETHKPFSGYDRVMCADTDIGRYVVGLKRRLSKAYAEYNKLEDEYRSLEAEHGLRPPGDANSMDSFNRVTAQAWMVDKLEAT